MCINRKKTAAYRKKNVRKEVVEGIVMDILTVTVNSPAMRVITGEKVYEYYSRQNSSDDSYRRSLEDKIKDTEKTLGNIMKAIEAGIFNETTQARMLELQQQYSLKPEHVVRYLESFTGNLSNPEVRQRVLDLLINKIILSDDSITITFNFSDDRREFDIKEMAAVIENRERIMEILDRRGNGLYNNELESEAAEGALCSSDFFA